jgi:hypothetical protein
MAMVRRHIVNEKKDGKSAAKKKSGLRLEVRRVRTQIREGVIEEYGTVDPSFTCDEGTLVR